MHLPSLAAAIAAAACMLSTASAASVQHLSSFTATNAGFLNVLPVNGAPALVVSAFTGNPLAADQVLAALSLDNQNLMNVTLSTLTSSITWPNEVALFPSNVSNGNAAALLVGGGFLVPPKCVGAVTVLDPATGKGTVLSTPKGDPIFGGWFYHRPLLKDVNGDGLVDILVPRAIKPLIGTPAGELIALIQPSSADNAQGAITGPWIEQLIINGSFAPDVFSALATLRGASDVDEQLVFTSFFTGGGLAMLLCPKCGPGTPPSQRNTWSNTQSLQLVILDTSLGASFDVSVVDLNGDGKLDLLVTNHVSNETQSGVYAYETPAAGVPLTDASAWTKHTLASGFVTREPGLPGTQASPGAARAFFPCANSGQVKPTVSVAGDGDQRFYLLNANSDSDPANWSYTLNEVWDCKGTVGQQAPTALTPAHVQHLQGTAAAADAQRALEASCDVLFVPCYDSSTVEVFMFTP
jgi:hypothetical protein